MRAKAALSILQGCAQLEVKCHLGLMRLAATALALTLALPAYAHEDLDGSYGELSRALQGTVEAFVTDKLRDPKGEETICGEANARNGCGGYNGFEPFAITIHESEKWSRYVPFLFDVYSRPSLRAAVSRQGC